MNISPLKAKTGTKFIIVFTLPSGAKMAAGGSNGLFALVPVDKDGKLTNVLSWDDSREVAKWLKEFRKQVGEDQWPKWWALRPALARVAIEQ